MSVRTSRALGWLAIGAGIVIVALALGILR